MKKCLNIAFIVALIFGLTGVVSATTMDVVTNVGPGYFNQVITSYDTSSLHPGQIGQQSAFFAEGDFAGDMSGVGGNYGSLQTRVHFSSGSYGASFDFADTQYFNVLSGNHTYNVVGSFSASAYGSNDQVAMNLKSVGSMYVWSEATDPYSAAPLSGSFIQKTASTTKNGNPNSQISLAVWTDGVATMSNSNIWGWGISETGSVFSNYAGGTRTVSTTGNTLGSYSQVAAGVNGVSINGLTVNGTGNFALIGDFAGDLSGTYTMSAY